MTMVYLNNNTEEQTVYIPRTEINTDIYTSSGEIDLTDYYTKEEVDELIENVEVDINLDGYATEQWVEDKTYATEQYVDDKGYVVSTNLKTINGESLLGEGDITVGSGGSGTDVDLSNYVQYGSSPTFGSVRIENESYFGSDGSSYGDVSYYVAANMKSGKGSIRHIWSENIHLGVTSDGELGEIKFVHPYYGDVSEQYQGDEYDIVYAKIDNQGNIYEGTTKLSDKYATKEEVEDAIAGIEIPEGGGSDDCIIIYEPVNYSDSVMTESYEGSARQVHNAEMITKIKNHSVKTAFLALRNNRYQSEYIYIPMSFGWEEVGGYGYLTGVSKYWNNGNLVYNYIALDMYETGLISKYEVDNNLDGYATEQYVDDAIAGIEIPEGGGSDVDLSNYYTKEEIDATLGNINSILSTI